MIENHTTSLEISRKLKELGVPQNGHFYWDVDLEGGKPELFSLGQIKPSWLRPSNTCSAFLASELGEILPVVQVDNNGSNWNLKIEHDFDMRWRCFYGNDGYFSDENLANCLGKILIYLIENGLLKI